MENIISRLIFIVSFASFGLTNIAYAQDANIRLEKTGSFYEQYNDTTKIVSGIEIIIGAEGTNYENYITSDVEISLYIIPCNRRGTITSTDPIIIKKFVLAGGSLHQRGKFTFSNLSADLGTVKGLHDGKYRLGAWVNSNTAIPNPPDPQRDNAGLLNIFGGTDEKSIIYFTARKFNK